jgi:ribosomal protein S18 acetylase RimI-like enzyme
VLNYADFLREHLDGVVAICREEGWPSYATDREITWRALTAPGVSAVVALEDSKVVGFAYLQSDGVIQAHLTLVAVARACRRKGIGRRPIEEAFARSGAQRIDLVSTEGADDFYRSFRHRAFPGFRIYPATRR